MHSLLLSQAQTELPPEGLSRGRWPAPRWAIAAIGAVIVIAAIAYLVVRLRRARRGKR